MSLDPLAHEFANISPYNYVLGNPISLVDPTGRSPEGYTYFVDGVKVEGEAEQSLWDTQIGKYSKAQTGLSNAIEDYNEAEAAAEASCSGCPQWVKDVTNTSASSVGDSPVSKAATAIPFAAVDGPLPVADAIIATLVAAAAADELLNRKYITYILGHPSGQMYFGRSSGFLSPDDILRRRLYGHRMKALGVTRQVDKVAQGNPYAYWAIRGREQQLIDWGGGVGAPQVANSVRGVSRYNPMGPVYHWTSNVAFGQLHPYTGADPRNLLSQ